MSKIRILNRRDFLKTTAAGTVLAVSPATGRSKDRKSSASTRKGTIVRADMSKCTPAKSLTRDFEKDHWCLIDFETVEGVKGFMVSARPDEKCGELTLPLDAKGVYKIYLGQHETKSHYRGSSSYGQLEVKLTRDKGFRRVGPEHGTEDEDGTTKFGEEDPNIEKSITEAYWKTADLTGQSLTFRQMPYPYNRPEHGRIANISYIKLVPLTKEELRAWKEMQPREETRNLALIFCTGQFTGHTRGTYNFHPTSKDWFRDEFEPFADSDIKILIFEALRGSSCVYRTKIGSLGTKDNRWKPDWKDPLAEFTKLAHNNGMKIFASMRFIGPQYPMNRSPIAWAPNYWKHPELTMRTKEGNPITNLSLAYPEVRQYWLSLLRETLGYGTDGVQLHFNRSEPYVFYEEPVVKAFQEKYGEDPRKLDHEDPRWLAHTAGYVTQFVREVRKLVDEKPGRELGVTLSGRKNGYEVHYEENQGDVDTWIREGLVNYVMPTPYLHETLLKKWRRIGGNNIHIWPDIMPRSQTAMGYARSAKKYYKAGADGLCFWDGERRTARISEWAAARRLGHRDQLDRIIREGPSYYRAVDLKILGGFDVKWSFKDG
ncbi:family 10 glycosylhydrolase [bacterium]